MNVSERISTCLNISERIQMYQNVSKCIRTYPNMSECIQMYQNVSKYIRTYPNVVASFNKLLRCILSLYYSGLLGIVCWLAAERAIYDPKWLWDNEVLSSFLFQFWTLCETKNDTTTTAPQTTAAGCKLFQATVARWCLVVP